LELETLIGKGRTADVYAWGEGRILKLYQSWMPVGGVAQEFALTRAAQAAGVPVPAAYELVEVEGRHGIVFERITGVSLLSELQARPARLFAIARQLAELHAQIHAVRTPDGLPAQRRQIESGIEDARGLEPADRQIALDSLKKLPDGESLCHGDFHPDNILMSARGPVIIDWMTGTRGQPLADVARTSMILQTGGLPPGMPLPARMLINASRAILHAIYLNRYLQLCPASRAQIEQWRLPLLAARLREVNDYPQERQLLLGQLKTVIKSESH
jgi:uncharacterized protein (TIGR02172 family)